MVVVHEHPQTGGVQVYQGSVLVTQGLADALFPQGGAVGKVLELPDAPNRFTIVGIVGIGFGLWWADAVAAAVIALDVVHDPDAEA